MFVLRRGKGKAMKLQMTQPHHEPSPKLGFHILQCSLMEPTYEPLSNLQNPLFYVLGSTHYRLSPFYAGALKPQCVTFKT